MQGISGNVKRGSGKKTGLVLNGNEVPFDVFFNSLAKTGKIYIALDLANADTLENAKINHQKSIDYLRKNF